VRDKPGSIFIADGKIAALDVAPAGFKADEVIDAKGLVAAPGLVDLAARLREPGFEYKATLESEMRAAVAGGVTTLACPPDTDPPLDEPGLVEMLTRRAASLDSVRVHPLGALTVGLKGERLAEMAELTDAGCVGFSQGNAALPGTATLLQALRYVHSIHRVVAAGQPARGGGAHEGSRHAAGSAPIPRSRRRLLANHPRACGAAGAAYIARLSSGKSVELAASAAAASGHV
jgi:dihydroorotase